MKCVFRYKNTQVQIYYDNLINTDLFSIYQITYETDFYCNEINAFHKNFRLTYRMPNKKRVSKLYVLKPLVLLVGPPGLEPGTT